VAESPHPGRRIPRAQGAAAFLAPQPQAPIATPIAYHTTSPTNSIRCGWTGHGVFCAYSAARPIPWSFAQEQKLDHILDKLLLQPGERFSGHRLRLGALVLRAAKKYGARATGVTLSRISTNSPRGGSRKRTRGPLRGAPAGLPRYSGEGAFDKIASVGMFEHWACAISGLISRKSGRSWPMAGSS